MKTLNLVVLAVGLLLLFASAAFAQTTATPTSYSASGSGLGAGWGFGRIGAAALESMARQPEVAPRIQTAMIIIGALLEGATFFSLIVCILLLGKATF